jgi:N-acetylneuraminate synthase
MAEKIKVFKDIYNPPKFVAEVGCNHKGNIEIAIDLIIEAKNCGADVVKFQKRNNRELLTSEEFDAPHPNPANSYGDSYGEHREFLELDLEQHKILKNKCNEEGIEYSTSVWDVSSAEEMTSLKPKFLKIPSACNTNFDILETLIDRFDGFIHLSLGMTSREEEKKIFDYFDIKNSLERLILYSCTSGYPVPPKDVCILEIERLLQDYGKKIEAIGFSGHHTDSAIDLSSIVLGATWIERHFTKSKKWKGTDHSASLEPQDMTKLIQDLKLVAASLKYKNKDILDIEIAQREKLKFFSKS